jgi:flagella basal body P-ring formation protein FlgA
MPGMPLAVHTRMKAFNWLFHPAVAALALICACSLLHATDINQDAVTPIETLRRVANDTIQAHARDAGGPVTVTLTDPDPRLRLAACTRPVEGAIVGDGELHDFTTVGIRCNGAVHWAIYVRATVTTELTVLVARSVLARGSEPSMASFDRVRRNVPGTGADYVTSEDGLRGLRLRTPLAAGEVLTRARLETAALVHRGQRVTLLARNAGIEIRVAAIALADGRPSELIQVQNENSRQVVDAVVREAGVVEVPL